MDSKLLLLDINVSIRAIAYILSTELCKEKRSSDRSTLEIKKPARYPRELQLRSPNSHASAFHTICFLLLSPFKFLKFELQDCWGEKLVPKRRTLAPRISFPNSGPRSR